MVRARPIALALHAVMAVLLASVACATHAQAPTIALLLPSQQTIFGQAAEAVRQGFFAAHKAEGSAASLQVIEIDDAAEQLPAALAAARDRGVKVVVGPLTRVAVNTLVEGRHATMPIVALNHADWDNGVPATMITLGLSAEAEAQRVVRVALAEFVGAARSVTPRFVVMTGASSLERRVSAAFVAALRAQSELAVMVDVRADALEHASRTFETGRFDAAFLALNARDAALVRARIPRNVMVFATSMVNAGYEAGSPMAIALAHELDGVRFVDMPWILQPDHAAVMIYPAPSPPLPVDMARLYALGIDAYRVAQQWLLGRARFDLDGVSGQLHVDRSRGPRVERIPVSAVFRNGAIVREEVGR